MNLTSKNAADVQAIVDAMNELKIDETITYEELTEIVGRDIRNHRYIMTQARNRLLLNRKIFGCITNVGYKRMNDSEIVESSHGIIHSIHNKARKQVKSLTAVDWQSLTNNNRVNLNIHISVLGAIAHATTPSTIAKLSPACTNSNGIYGLPTEKTLKLLAS